MHNCCKLLVYLITVKNPTQQCCLLYTLTTQQACAGMHYAGSWPAALWTALHASRCPSCFHAAFWHSGEQYLPGHAPSAKHKLEFFCSLARWKQQRYYLAMWQPVQRNFFTWLSDSPCRAVHLRTPHSTFARENRQCLEHGLQSHFWSVPQTDLHWKRYASFCPCGLESGPCSQPTSICTPSTHAHLASRRDRAHAAMIMTQDTQR